jgi:hypothetical protein
MPKGHGAQQLPLLPWNLVGSGPNFNQLLTTPDLGCLLSMSVGATRCKLVQTVSMDLEFTSSILPPMQLVKHVRLAVVTCLLATSHLETNLRGHILPFNQQATVQSSQHCQPSAWTETRRRRQRKPRSIDQRANANNFPATHIAHVVQKLSMVVPFPLALSFRFMSLGLQLLPRQASFVASKSTA